VIAARPGPRPGQARSRNKGATGHCFSHPRLLQRVLHSDIFSESRNKILIESIPKTYIEMVFDSESNDFFSSESSWIYDDFRFLNHPDEGQV